MTDKEIVYKIKKIKKYQDLSAEHKKGANAVSYTHLDVYKRQVQC